jgi:hypothetical protein
MEESQEEQVLELKPETELFVRGLVDSFYKNREFKIDTKNNKFWDLFISDVMTAVKDNNLKKKIILTRDGEEEYLIRYYLINERPKLRVTIHNTLLSDGANQHNHPWAWGSLMLTGGYWEDTPEGRFWRAPGEFRVRKAKDLHRLEVDPTVKEPVWTLFIMGEKEQDWGFLNEDGNIEQWQEYLHRQRGVWYEDQ